MICSLTRTSAREVARRAPIPDEQVGTLHSMAYHALGGPEMAEGHLEEWNAANPSSWALTGARDVRNPFDLPKESKQNGDALMMNLASHRTRHIPAEGWTDDLRTFAQAWDDWKRQNDYLDFSDLIEHGRSVERAPGDPAVIMVDEGQDFGLAEMELVRHWARHVEHLVVAGDYHQAIFVWRGGDPQVLAGMATDPHVLSQSYRIPRAVHTQAMRWMQRIPLPPVTFAPRCEGGVAEHVALRYQQPAMLPALVTRLLDQYKDVMLLTTCQYMLDPLLAALRGAGIPYHNPWRPHAGAWNPLAGGAKRLTLRDRVLAFLRPSRDLYGGQARFWTMWDIKVWALTLPARGIFTPRSKTVIERSGEMKDEEIAVRMKEWFQPEALERILLLDVTWYVEHADVGGTQVKPFVQRILTRDGPQALAEKPRVVVGTVHSLKGSEASAVVLFPDISPTAYHGNTAVRDEVARTFYVGVTRAREALYLAQASSRYAVAW